LTPSWKFTLVRHSATDIHVDREMLLDDQSHVYSNVWVADAWINRRTVRILVKQIILDFEYSLPAEERNSAQVNDAIAVIQQMSTDLCLSVHSFRDNPREYISILHTRLCSQ
jgi:hypothetical protein